MIGLPKRKTTYLPCLQHHAREPRSSKPPPLQPINKGSGSPLLPWPANRNHNLAKTANLSVKFTDRDAVRQVAVELNEAKPLDAVIHNVGVWSGRAVMPVNIVAPYLLTALLPGPSRLVYLSSSFHFGGRPSLDGIDWRGQRAGSYDDSKLFVTTLAAAVARLRPEVLSNAVDPGWVPTNMGGTGAPDDLEMGHRTQEWLVSSNDSEALTSGGY